MLYKLFLYDFFAQVREIFHSGLIEKTNYICS